MPFDIGSLTDVGRRRSGNEDALDVLSLAEGEGALCVVADGMGGHQAGEVASRLAVDTIRRTFEGGDQSFEALLGAIRSANRAVLAEASADAAKQGMGTTVVCALLRGGRGRLANVGDSPAFLVRGEEVRPLTQDHSWVAEEIARGALGQDEAAAHPYRHVLTRCLGMDEQVEVQAYEPIELQAGDALVLCSDGLSEHVRPEELPPLVLGRSAEAAAEALVDLANERGGSDNITVIVARYEQSMASDQQPTLRLPNALRIC
jgi:serine/threonine protein phosphatase PrpC